MIYKQECVVNGANGVYIPQVLAERCPEYFDNEALLELAKGPDNWDDETVASIMDELNYNVVNDCWLELGDSGDVFECSEIPGLEAELVNADEKLAVEALDNLDYHASIEEMRYQLTPNRHNSQEVNDRLAKLLEILKHYY